MRGASASLTDTETVSRIGSSKTKGEYIMRISDREKKQYQETYLDVRQNPDNPMYIFYKDESEVTSLEDFVRSERKRKAKVVLRSLGRPVDLSDFEEPDKVREHAEYLLEILADALEAEYDNDDE